MNKKLFSMICNKLSRVCILMSKDKDRTLKESKRLIKYSEEFKGIGKVYANLGRKAR